MNRTTKQPGLSFYEPVLLRKGVTSNQGLYNWYKEVHNDVYDLNSGNEIVAGLNVVPVHDPRFRREMIISVLDREGRGVKHWLCLNCFPISYKGGDSLDAKSEDKLIEELGIAYEAFIELKGEDLNEAFDNAQVQSNEALAAALEAVAIGAFTGGIAGTLGSIF
jgi:phage tail-like protein